MPFRRWSRKSEIEIGLKQRSRTGLVATCDAKTLLVRQGCAGWGISLPLESTAAEALAPDHIRWTKTSDYAGANFPSSVGETQQILLLFVIYITIEIAGFSPYSFDPHGTYVIHD